MKRNFYKIVHWIARKFRMERLAAWSYLKWMYTYADEPFGFWHFAGDYVDMKFSYKDFRVDDMVFNSGEDKKE